MDKLQLDERTTEHAPGDTESSIRVSVKGRSPRVFLGLTEVSGYYSRLKEGFEKLGISCVHVALQQHRFAYEPQEEFRWTPPALARYCVARRVRVPERERLRRLLWLVPVLASRVLLFLWAAARFDVFILGGSSSFFRFVDLPLLRLLGRRIIYVLHGTDGRPAYIDGAFYEERHASGRHDATEPPELDDGLVAAYIRTTRRLRREVFFIERFANAVVCVPSYGHLLRRRFINFIAVGIPFASRREPITPASPTGSSVRVLHAPSDRVVRGTAGIRRVVKDLCEKGIPLEFVEVSGRSNSEILDEIERCDFVVDGLYADTPMAGFATEASYFGKPVIVGGYYAEAVRRDMDEEFIPPTVFCHPDRIEDAMRYLALNAEVRIRIGRTSKDFVRSRWNPCEVAQKFLCILAGDIPPSWWCDPREIRYVHGAGLPEARARRNVQAVIARGGERALQLDANPVLRALFVEFAGRSKE